MEASCPQCGTGHLHVDVLVAADPPAASPLVAAVAPSRFVATGFAENGNDVVVVANELGRWEADTAFVSCCACDWNDERPIRLVGPATGPNSSGPQPHEP
jgi:hypothetical protein